MTNDRVPHPSRSCEGGDKQNLRGKGFGRRAVVSHPSQSARRMGHPIIDYGMEGKFVRSECEFDGGLQNARAADTVDVADAAAEGRGNLTEVRSDRGGGQAEGRCVGHVEGVEAGFQVRLAINREGLGK